MSDYKDPIKKASELRKDKMSFRSEWRDFCSFVKKLVGVLFGLSILGLGVVAIYYGQTHVTTMLYRIALVVSGTFTAIDGLYILYKVLQEKK